MPALCPRACDCICATSRQSSSQEQLLPRRCVSRVARSETPNEYITLRAVEQLGGKKYPWPASAGKPIVASSYFELQAIRAIVNEVEINAEEF